MIVRRVFSAFVIALLFLGSSSAGIRPGPTPGCISFSWTEPQTNTDGSPLTNLLEYRLYISQTPGVYGTTPFNVLPAPDANPPLVGRDGVSRTLSMNCVPGIPVGQNYAVVTAVNIDWVESGYSNEVSFIRP